MTFSPFDISAIFAHTWLLSSVVIDQFPQQREAQPNDDFHQGWTWGQGAITSILPHFQYRLFDVSTQNKDF